MRLQRANLLLETENTKGGMWYISLSQWLHLTMFFDVGTDVFSSCELRELCGTNHVN